MCKTVTKRTLTKWRSESLIEMGVYNELPENKSSDSLNFINELNSRILRLTQILLDQELMKGK
jgi:hypothetical protein